MSMAQTLLEKWSLDTQPNDIHLNDTQSNDIHLNDTQMALTLLTLTLM
jgi:hypothetical protein